MENLNDLIWMDEDDNDGIGTQNVGGGSNPPMSVVCMVISCTTQAVLNPIYCGVDVRPPVHIKCSN